jgi:hypothetical protein
MLLEEQLFPVEARLLLPRVLLSPILILISSLLEQH